MLKCTILYKNGKTWNGKVKHVDDLDFTASDIVHITVKHSGGYTVLYPARGPWYDKESLRIEQVHLTRHISIPKVRTPNPNSKTKKQKAFDEAYLEWTMEHFAKYDNCPSLKEYKKWLWEQKNEKAVKVDKDGFIPWNGGEMPVPYGTMVHVKYRDGEEAIVTAGILNWYPDFKGDYDGRSAVCWKHREQAWDVVAYKVVEEDGIYAELQQGADNPKKSHSFFNVHHTPIKTTYTFWLGANGEIVDGK